MLDPRLIRNELEATAAKLKRRGYVLDVERLATLESQRKALQVRTQELQNERNTRSKSIGKSKAQGEDIAPLLAAVGELGEQLKQAEEELNSVQQTLQSLFLDIPNIPHESTPDGLTEEESVEIRRWGEATKLSFPPKEHVELGEALGGMDFETASKISGSRYVVMSGALAHMHRALIQFMLDIHTQEHGYTELYVPYVVNSDSLRGTGQLPKFAEDLFKLNTEQDHYLIPTGEVPVTNIVRDTIIEDAAMPRKFVSHTPCFRSEAGSYGKDTRGLIRQHQFEKVELVQVVREQESHKAHNELTAHAEAVLQRLGLPYRVVALCCGDMGFSSAKTFDLEVWLPGQNAFREISSCSNFEAFQARRLQARWRNPETGKPELVHTLNGSGLAVGRCLVAIMENYQDEQGRIHVPAALQTYMGDVTIIDKS